jgi:hypothetical protein
VIGRPSLAKLAHTAGVPERTQEKDYVLAWLLAAMSASGDVGLVLKGGTSLRRCYFRGYRYSEDLDFTAVATGMRASFLSLASAWCRWIGDEAGIRAEAMPDKQNPARRVWIGYQGPLGAFRSAEIKLDVATDERILLAPMSRPLISEYSDLPDQQFSVPTYDLVEIWAEKVRTLIQRSEPRDVYDLVALVASDAKVPGSGLEPFLEKARAKGLRTDNLAAKLDEREPVLRQRWTGRLKDQVRSLPDFDGEWRTLRRALRQAGYLHDD